MVRRSSPAIDSPVCVCTPRRLSRHGCHSRYRRLGRDAEMPAEPLFQLAKHRARQPAEIPLFTIAVLFILANAIRENVIDPQLHDTEAVPLDQLTPLVP